MNSKFSGHVVRRAAGYTLLELLLALGLTVVIISLIASAIQTNGLTLTRVQSSIERKQAARGILGMMQNDLRAGIQYKANEYAGLQDLFRSIQLAAGQSIVETSETGTSDDQEGELDPQDQLEQLEQLQQLGETLAAAGETGSSSRSGETGSSSGGTSSSSRTGDSEFEEEIEEPEVEGAPVFIGASNFFSIDISRLPRIDEYHPSIRNAQERANTLADVKTVSYFVSPGNGPNQSQNANFIQVAQGQAAVTGGLFRRQIDRSVAKYEGLENTSVPDLHSELVANEVVEVSFRYFDGNNWFTNWDSEDMGGFPLAVGIYVLIDPARAGSIGTGGSGSSSRENLESYRAVVHIPAAEIVEEEDDG